MPIVVNSTHCRYIIRVQYDIVVEMNYLLPLSRRSPPRYDVEMLSFALAVSVCEARGDRA